MTEKIQNLVYECNEIYRASNGENLITQTNKVTRTLINLGKPISDPSSYGDFIDGLYKTFYEGSKSGSRLGSKRSEIIKDINILRMALRHDLNHGKQSKIRAKERKIGDTIKKYSGKSNIGLLDENGLKAMQLKILDSVRNMLENVRIKIAS